MIGRARFLVESLLHGVRARRFVREVMTPAVDRERLRDIERRLRGAAGVSGGPRYFKYFDAERHLARAAARAVRLGLHRGPARSVLDLGCGFGYFLLACRLLGHTAVGLDLPRPGLLEVADLLGVHLVLCRIEAYRPLPSLPGEPFDLVTAFGIVFNNHNRPDLWDVAEWRFLIDDLARHVRPGARAALLFNRERATGRYFSEALYRFFRERHASIRRSVRLVELPLNGVAPAAPVALAAPGGSRGDGSAA